MGSLPRSCLHDSPLLPIVLGRGYTGPSARRLPMVLPVFAIESKHGSHEADKTGIFLPVFDPLVEYSWQHPR